MSEMSPSSGVNEGTGAGAGSSQPRGKYTAKACNECRRRRAKCSGVMPCCARCQRRGLDCVYSEVEDGRRPGSKLYVDKLRRRINDLESILRRNSITPEASTVTPQSAERQSPRLLCNATPPVDSAELPGDPITQPAEPESSSTVAEGTLSMDDSLNFEEDGEIRYFGATSGRLDFSSAPSGKDLPLHPRSSRASAVRQARSEMFRQFAADDSDRISEELHSHLIDLFFKWIHPWCPLIDEKLFRQSMRTKGRYYSPLLEKCILALGSRLSDSPDVRSDPDDPDTAGMLFLEKAEVFLFYELKWPNITTIQSLSLLNFLHVGFGFDAAGWLRQGMAIRLALDMGLNLEASLLTGSDMISGDDARMRRQIFWALYCDDKLSAMYTGRVCTLMSCQISIREPPIQQDTTSHSRTNEIDDDPGTTFLSALVRVSKILEKIIISLYAPSPSIRNDQRSLFFDSCSDELQTWLSDLHPGLRIKQTPSASILPHFYVLHMVHQTAQILLGKPFIAKVGHASDSDTSGKGVSSARTDTSDKASKLVYDSAKRICDFARKYQDAFGSFRRCPLTATHCTLSACLVLIQSSSINGRSTPSDLADANLCLRVLDELSRSWKTAGKLRRGLLRMLQSQHESDQQMIDPLITSLPEGHNLAGKEVAGASDLDMAEQGDTFGAWWHPEQGVDADLETMPLDYQVFEALSHSQFNNLWQ